MAKRILALTLVLLSLLSCVILPTNAATSGRGKNTYTITVITKANWSYPGSESITLTQTKGTFLYSKTDWLGRRTGETLKKTMYGTWDIHVMATDGSHSYWKDWNGGSIKLTLKGNKTYKITLYWDGTQEFYNTCSYRDFRWTNLPTWRVKSTWKVSNYY